MVNPLIGDKSFYHSYYLSPLFISFFLSFSFSFSFETFRIYTHLKYVHSLLSKKDNSYLSPKLQKNRKEGLNNLEEYINKLIFPTNENNKKREPVFVDKDGRMCAVAYLMHCSGIQIKK